MAVLDLSAYKPVPATLGDANQIANGFTAIQTCINALDNNNFAAGKIFDPLKLMQDGATAGQGLVWSATANGGTGGWVPASVAPVSYRRSSVLQVVNTVTETDLLGGSITIGAGVMGTTGIMRLTAWGDWLNNSGGVQALPALKVKLGATTIFSLPAMAGFWTAAVTRQGWKAVVEIANAGATNAQVSAFFMKGYAINSVGAGLSNFVTGVGSVYVSLTAGGFGAYEAIGDGFGTAVDTTVAQALAFTCTHGAANAALDMTLRGALAEII